MSESGSVDPTEPAAEPRFYVVAERLCWVLENVPDEFFAGYCDGGDNHGCEGCLGGGKGRRLDVASAKPVEKAGVKFANVVSYWEQEPTFEEAADV